MKKYMFLLLVVLFVLIGCNKENQESQGYRVSGDDLHIFAADTTISNMTIEGDLYVDLTVSSGEFHINDTTVKGDIIINGGGPNSGYLVNVYGQNLIIESTTNPNIVLDMNTQFEGVQLACDCRLESNGSDIKTVAINNQRTSDAVNIILKGDYPEVTLESTANVKIDGVVSLMSVLKGAGLTSIDMVDTSTVYFYSCYGQSVTISGGTIIEAWINAEYCSLPESTEQINSEVGVAEVTVGNVSYNIPEHNDEIMAETTTEADESTQSDANSNSENETADTADTDNQNTSDSNAAESDMDTDSNQTETTEEDTTSSSSQETATDENSDEDTTSQSDSENDEQDGTTNPPDDHSDDGSTESAELSIAASGYPTISKSNSIISIAVMVNKPCTLYALVEADMVFEEGSTPENVRNGISAGAGMVMDDGMQYTVIYKSFQITSIDNVLTLTIDMMDYMSMEGDEVPSDMTSSVGVFIVLEDEFGNLSPLYSLN